MSSLELSHPCGNKSACGKSGYGYSKSGSAASLAESLRLSVNYFSMVRGYASLFCSQAFGQLPKPLWLAFIILVIGIISSGCSQSSTNRPAEDSSTTTQPSTSPVQLKGFERDLQFIRNGKFSYVWVFSRKDGKPLDKDDGDYLRVNAPQVVDWVTTEDNKRVIGGTNFDLEQGNMPQLRQRFVVEDYTGK